MKKSMLTGVMVFLAVLLVVLPAHAQMIGWGSQNQGAPSQSDIKEEENMQNQGSAVYQKLKNGTITCQKLTNDDYEKLGEYFMGQAAGSTENHVVWDQRIQQMMGDQGDTQMHIDWGERGSGCESTGSYSNNLGQWGNGFGMMGYGNRYGMMGGNWANTGVGSIVGGAISWALPVFLVIDLVLLTVLLWKKIKSNK